MTILKAILFTILLFAIEATLSFGFLSLNEVLDISPDNLIHYGQITKIITQLLAYFIMLSLIFKLRFNHTSCFVRLRNIDAKTFLLVLVTLFGYKLLQRPLLDFNLIIDSINNNVIEPINGVNDKYKYVIGYKVVSAVILAPILEELFFRKILLNGLLKKYSFAISAIISSLCFALMHWTPDLLRIMPMFIFGIICCLIYIKTKNILYPILFHFAGNLISTILSIYSNQLFAFQQELNYNWIYWAAFVFGIGVTIFGLRKITTANRVGG